MDFNILPVLTILLARGCEAENLDHALKHLPKDSEIPDTAADIMRDVDNTIKAMRECTDGE